MSEKGISGAGVGVLVLRDNKVLLGLRASDPTKADSELHGESTWTMPGGKIHFGESFEQAGNRELLEETGLIANTLRVFSLSNDQADDVHFVTVGLLCDHFSGEVQAKEPEEIIEWRWFDLNNVPDNMFFPSRKMLDNYLSGKFYQLSVR